MNRFKTLHITETITTMAYIAGVILSLLLFGLARHWEHEHIENEFNRVFIAHANAFERELELNLELLASTVSFYNASNNVSTDEFTLFTHDHMKQLPGLSSISWAPKVTHQNFNEISALVNSEGIRLNYALSQTNIDGNTDHVTYAPIIYTEPLASNINLLGFNIIENNAMKKAAIHAQDANIISFMNGGLLTSSNTPTVTAVLPVYRNLKNSTRRKALFGFVLGTFKISTLFEKSIDQLHSEENKINLDIINKSTGDLIYQRGAGENHSDIYAEWPISLGDQEWVLTSHPPQSFIDDRSTMQPPLILTTSLLITLLLTSIFHSLSKKQQLIEQTVKQRTLDLAQSEQKLRTILDSTSNGIILINENGKITLINPAIEEMFGYQQNELIDQDFSILLPLSSHGNHSKYIEQYKQSLPEDRPNNIEAHGIHKNGSKIPIHITVNELRHDDQLFFVCVLMDITERVQSDKIKSEFISTVSHELRTPLTAINGALKLIQLQSAEMSPQVENLLTIATRNTERQLSLVNDLLDLQKISAGQMTFLEESFSISKLALSCIEGVQSIADNARLEIITVDHAGNTIVLADKTRLGQVITNLLSNAIKFSPPNGKITVLIEQRDNAAYLSVTDEGPGIPAHFKTRIFKRFAQADSSDQRNASGTGLGLAICNDFMKGMNGDIGYHSIPGERTTFFITIPTTSHQEESGKPEATTSD